MHIIELYLMHSLNVLMYIDHIFNYKDKYSHGLYLKKELLSIKSLMIIFNKYSKNQKLESSNIVHLYVVYIHHFK
jgi:hypothetical protein